MKHSRELDPTSQTILFCMLEVRMSFINLKNWGAGSVDTANTEIIKKDIKNDIINVAQFLRKSHKET